MAKLGLVDDTSGTLSTVSDAGAAMISADTAQTIRDAIGLGTAATEQSDAFASAEQGQQGAAAYTWGDHGAASYVAAPSGALPELDGGSLTRLPTQWASYAANAASVASSAAETEVVSLTIPAGLLARSGDRVRLRSFAKSLNNSGGNANTVLRIKLEGTSLWGDTRTNGTATDEFMVVTEIEVLRISDTQAHIGGLVRINAPSIPSEGVGMGELSTVARATTNWLADNPVTVDFDADMELTITIQFSVSAATVTWTGLYDMAESNVVGVYTAPDPPPPPPAEVRDWMETQYPSNPFTRTLSLTAPTGFPKLSTGTMKQSMTADELSTYDMAFSKPFRGDTFAAAQAINANLMIGRDFVAPEYNGYADAEDSFVSGPQFLGTGATTTETIVFAGHWLYKPFTTLGADIGTGTGTYSVANASLINAGEYAVIYPSGNWGIAEHVYVSGRDTINNTVTLSVRGYKSTARSHLTGYRIATHQKGNGSDNRCWAFNFSTQCPTDGAGKTAGQFRAEWLAANYDLDGSGDAQACRTDGVLYDSDFHYFASGGSAATRGCDADNDGTVDYGIGPNGVNWYGDGLDAFYAAVRSGLDARGGAHAEKFQIGGDGKTFGLASLNGTQLEGMPDDSYTAHTATPNYGPIHAYLSMAHTHDAHPIGPRLSDMQAKSATAMYPASTGASSNSVARLRFALSCIFDCFSSEQNNTGDSADRWYDFYAVDLTPGGTYGNAIAKTNYSGRRTWNKWLGQPLGAYQRIYVPSQFDWANNLISNGDFEAALSGWTSQNATVVRSSGQAYEGTYSLSVSPGSWISKTYLSAAAAISPAIQFTSGVEYSFSFAVYCANPRRVQIAAGSANSAALYIPSGWSKHVWSWRHPTSETVSLRLECGVDQDETFFDQLFLVAKPGNVIRRDFEGGIVVANCMPTAQPVDLGNTYQRILGTQDQVDNGALVTNLTIPAWDAAILVNAPE